MIPIMPPEVPFPSGELEAQRRLNQFIEGKDTPVYRYGDLRNRMDLEGTSGLSPYLRFGMLSARWVVNAVLGAEELTFDAKSLKGAETWLDELIWREFYIAILYHFPFVHRTAFRPAMRNILWQNNPGDFEAWVGGNTGYPIVDAAMRQLNQTGWLHNRARMIAASFLTKDLLIDWRWGERYFMQYLIDEDPASNNGGWQWTAGTGTDAAPYFRIFNPILQGKKFDPQGRYVRQFVRELVRVPDEYLHKPWEMPIAMQKMTGCIIGRDYPAPIVDHAIARQRALSLYKQTRKS
jgi:deoxyribodipyrimidine photo-lyase